MPAYISHLIMAKDVIKEGNLKNINEEYMITFSLGGDLSKYSSCRKQSHKEKQEEFILNMCDYVKDNNLLNDKKLIGAIYGHICHYVMDNILHPLIREIDKKCIKVGMKNHTLIEAYYDNYLLKKNKINPKKLLKSKVKNIKSMIDYAYLKTYGVKKVSLSYKITKFLYSQIHLLYIFPGKKLLSKILKYNKFIKINKEELKEKEFNLLYDESIKEGIEYINKINNYLTL